MFQSILIANRGEIACRIIRTAKKLGLRTVAVYSRADASDLHVRMADEAIAIGPAPASQSYLDSDAILRAARTSGAQCIHPGYGFLSENAAFAQGCADAGIVFIGPTPAAISAMGLKDEAKALMQKAGVPVTPGYLGADQSDDVLATEAEKIGYPVLIKAVAGGGGKGMRRVSSADHFAAALAAARREAQAAFGNDRVLLEKWITAPRHIEIQIIADTHGYIIHLNERDCSLQRRHQKVIEEAPAPGMTTNMRAAMGKAAVEAARAVGYTGAGTVEFIVSTADPGAFYFMEMNTRLQVEHPVTEAITGLDLVELQIRIAAGETLPLSHTDVPVNGHAIEARLYAEDPANGFLPSTGTIAHLRLPQGDGVRVDSGVAAGDEISPWYDPMVAKIISHGPNRATALARLQQALRQTELAGPKTNAAFLLRIATSDMFNSAAYTTGSLEEHDLTQPPAAEKPLPAALAPLAAIAPLAALALLQRQINQTATAADHSPSPWDACNGFQLSGPRQQALAFTIDGAAQQATITWLEDGGMEATSGGHTATSQDLTTEQQQGAVLDTPQGLYLRQGLDFFAIRPLAHTGAGAASAGNTDNASAPMHGRLTAILVKPGDKVAGGAQLAIVEAMKMEHVLHAPRDGVVDSVAGEPGAQVSQGDLIVTLKKQVQTETAQ